MANGLDIVVVGGCNFDYLVRGQKLPEPGETADGEEFQEAPGGKGANQALAVARLGARVAFLARVGDDLRGTACLKQLSDAGVDTDGVVRDRELHTGIALVLVDHQGRKKIMTSPGANRRLTPDDVLRRREQIEQARVVLAQLEVPTECVLTAFQIAREAGKQTVLDPAPAAPVSAELLELCDVVRPNATEAEVLTGVRVNDRSTARDAAKHLLGHGVGAVIVQAGDEGDLVVWADGEQWLPRLPVKSVDATGAGDAFAASLAVELSRGQSLRDAATFANAASALATTKLGAQAGLPTRDAVDELLRQNRKS